jgi:hypothetical protein
MDTYSHGRERRVTLQNVDEVSEVADFNSECESVKTETYFKEISFKMIGGTKENHKRQKLAEFTTGHKI